MGQLFFFFSMGNLAFYCVKCGASATFYRVYDQSPDCEIHLSTLWSRLVGIY